MATYLNTLFFRNAGGYGWSESYFTSLANIDLALRELIGDVPFRRGILAKGNFLEEARVSDVTIFRDSLVQTFSEAEGVGLYGAGAAFPAPGNEQAWDRLLCRVEAGSNFRRSYDLGGVPRGVISQTGVYLGPAEWLGPFGLWVGSHVGGVGVMLIGSNLAASESWPILGSSSPITNPRVLTIVISAAAQTQMALAQGDFVRIGRSHGLSNYKGLWVVDTVTPGTAPATHNVTFYARRYLVGYPVVNNQMGWVYKIAATLYKEVTQIRPRRGARRKTGRPFDAPAGIQRNPVN